MRMNAMHNAHNPNQGKIKRILCVCSAGLLRSPTLAGELYKRGYNTRAAGVHDYALIPIDKVLLHWADEIIFVQHDLKKYVEGINDFKGTITELQIPDQFPWRDPELVEIINSLLDKNGY